MFDDNQIRLKLQIQTFAALAIRRDFAMCTGTDRMSAVVETQLGAATIGDSARVGATLTPRGEHDQILERVTKTT